MQAFMAGKIKVQGDMTKLMAMQQGAPDPKAAEIAERIQGHHRLRTFVLDSRSGREPRLDRERKAGAVASSQWLGITASGTPPRWVKD